MTLEADTSGRRLDITQRNLKTSCMRGKTKYNNTKSFNEISKAIGAFLPLLGIISILLIRVILFVLFSFPNVYSTI